MSLYDFDKVTIVGKAGRDADQRYTPSGQAVTSFSVACDRSYKDKQSGQIVRRTIWYKVTVWGAFAETCAKITKGQKLFIEGTLTTDDNGNPKLWTKQDGSAGASFEVNASTVRFLSSAAHGQEQHEQPLTGAPEEDIPF